MIGFFRRIRKKLANENKFILYSRYAIGEIVLVVIGILIAISINNWNEDRKDQLKLRTLLYQIQRNLELDIQKAIPILDYYKEKDSLTKVLLMGNYTEADVRNPKLLQTIFSFQGFNETDDGYKSLLAIIDKVPDDYANLLVGLKDQFGIRIEDLTNSYEILETSSVESINQLRFSKPWYSEMIKGNLTEEAVDYFLNDSIYKNNVATYNIAAVRNFSSHLYDYWTQAIRNYHNLIGYLGDDEKIKDYVPRNDVEITDSELKSLKGVYKLDFLNLTLSFDYFLILEDEFNGYEYVFRKIENDKFISLDDEIILSSVRNTHGDLIGFDWKSKSRNLRIEKTQ